LPNDIAGHVGVGAERISTYLALTGGTKGRVKNIDLTKRQAIRLIELYGSIEDIYRRLGEIKPKAIREKMKLNRGEILSRYSKLIVRKRKPSNGGIESGWSWNICTRENQALLRSYGFYSLMKFLSVSDSERN
jgi:hypothetical protein